MRYVFLIAALVAGQQPAGKVIVTNERVTVRDLTLVPGTPGAMEPHPEDYVTVFLEGGTLKVSQPDGTSRRVTRKVNDVTFNPKGGSTSLEAVDRPMRVVTIELHDRAVPALANTSGLAEAFPRPGSKKVFENERLTVWDYTFVAGQPTPMHFHSRDVVTIYTEDGAVTSTTPAGDTVVNDHFAGEIRFNPRARAHTETLTRGKSHIVAVELK